MNIQSEQVEDSINSTSEDERDFVHLINCAPNQANSEYWGNVIGQRFANQEA